MKTIIAEKPSVAREIARIVGASRREEGYLSGNGYAVTWALGHLVQPALPDGYGYKGFHRDNLPIIPPVFKLIPRQVKGEKGYKNDPKAVEQIEVIANLFRKSELIIVATDAGREGELIFRYLYEYIGCAVPFDRLWISSLTDKAIREGLAHLECGAKYDKLYYAARARSEADWLVGINATQAVSVVAAGIYSLGRVQTPTLAMVCERYRANRSFQPETVWQTHFATGDGQGDVIKFSSAEKWKEKQPAEAAYRSASEAGTATVTKAERKPASQEPPLLYDLTTLQKEANAKHGYTAERTLEIAQKLYENKLITYPRTGSRYIPDDVFAEVPALLATLREHPKFGKPVAAITGAPLNRRSVDESKVTDHHALLITGEKPRFLAAEENTVYEMIAGRMVESFSAPCVKDTISVSATIAGTEYLFKGALVVQDGWRAVYGVEDDYTRLPDWKEGDTLPVSAASLTEGKTKPLPLHTEATLLAAMETAGRDIEDEEVRQSLKECGIGTPATRASIIETLFARGYVQRVKKSLVPTEKGLALYSVVKEMRIADVAMTGEWEAALARIERGELKDEVFRKDIEEYTAQITSELLACDKLFIHDTSQYLCPKCKKGRMRFYPKVVKCDNAECALPIFRVKAGKTLSDADIASLLTTGRTGIVKGFNSKQGRAFDAMVALDEEYNTVFAFPDKKKGMNPKKKK